MDGQKFDKLARAFASGTDRRTLLKIFGGATVAGVTGIAATRTSAVFAAGGMAGPGEECTTSDDCAQGSCYVATPGQPGVCYCVDPSRPVIGCDCSGDDGSSCFETTAVCCNGTCVSGMEGCNPQGCSDLQTSCAETGCCAEGTTCGANQWCNACYSGTEHPCGGVNEAFGANYICCTYGDDAVGAIGWCMAESECIVAPPNTGAGSTGNHERAWIAPVAAAGAAAALLAYKSRESKADSEV